MGKPDCQENVGGAQRSGSTRGTAASADSVLIQQNQKGLSLNETETEISIVGKPVSSVPIQSAMWDFPQNPVDEIIPKFGFCETILLHIMGGNLRCLCHSHDSRDIVCAGTPGSLLGAPVDKGTNSNTLADVHDSNPLRPVNLVAAGAEHVNVHLIRSDRYMGKSLPRVRVEQHPGLMGNLLFL